MLILPQEAARRRRTDTPLPVRLRCRRRPRPVQPLRTDDVLVLVLLARPPHRRRRRRHRGPDRRRNRRPPDVAAGHAHPRREVKLVCNAGAVEHLLRGLAPELMFSDVAKCHVNASRVL